MNSSIQIRSLSKRYGSILALDDVSLDVEGPIVMGILGPNGAGKSTLMKLITGILRPTSGSVKINGKNVTDDPRNVLMDVGSLIEQPGFYPYLTGYESLKFVCKIRGLSSRECEEEIERVGRITSSTPYLNRKTGNYSKGMNQRVGIAAAMICDPKILVLDEPTNGLDPKGMKEVREIIKKISRDGEHIVLISTHLLSEAREVCNRVTIINQGHLAYDSTDLNEGGNTITVRFDGEFRQAVLDHPSILQYRTESDRLIVQKSPGATNYDVVRYLVQSGLKVSEVSSYDDLEDRYVRIVSESGN